MAALLHARGGLRPHVAAKASSTAKSPSTSVPMNAQPPAVMLSDSKTEAFVQFCINSLGVSCTKLKPATFGGMRGMAASQPIAQEDMLISIPRSSAIVLNPKQKCPCPDFVDSQYWSKQPWFVKIGIMLLYEKSLGQKSRLAAYIEQLPATYESPVLWNDSQLKQLQYPYLIDKVTAQQKEWANFHKQFCAALKPGQQPVSQQQFLWALCGVRSRTFSGPYIGTSLQDRVKLAGVVAVLVIANIGLGIADTERTLTAAIAVFVFNVLYEVILSRSLKQYTMAPLMDFINHSATTQSEVSLDYFSDRYSVQAGRSFAPGEQVFISYGTEQTNDSLMQYYGFVEPDTPADTYTMTRFKQWLTGHIGPAPDRMKQLQDAGLNKSLEEVAVSRTGFPAATLNALRYLLADGSKAAAGPAGFEGPGSDEEEQRLAGMLVKICMDELNAMGTTLAQDQELLAGGSSNKKSSMSPELRLAVQFRIEKKKILKACLSSLGVKDA